MKSRRLMQPCGPGCEKLSSSTPWSRDSPQLWTSYSENPNIKTYLAGSANLQGADPARASLPTKARAGASRQKKQNTTLHPKPCPDSRALRCVSIMPFRLLKVLTTGRLKHRLLSHAFQSCDRDIGRWETRSRAPRLNKTLSWSKQLVAAAVFRVGAGRKRNSPRLSFLGHLREGPGFSTRRNSGTNRRQITYTRYACRHTFRLIAWARVIAAANES